MCINFDLVIQLLNFYSKERIGQGHKGIHRDVLCSVVYKMHLPILVFVPSCCLDFSYSSFNFSFFSLSQISPKSPHPTLKSPPCLTPSNFFNLAQTFHEQPRAYQTGRLEKRASLWRAGKAGLVKEPSRVEEREAYGGLADSWPLGLSDSHPGYATLLRHGQNPEFIWNRLEFFRRDFSFCVFFKGQGDKFWYRKHLKSEFVCFLS